MQVGYKVNDTDIEREPVIIIRTYLNIRNGWLPTAIAMQFVGQHSITSMVIVHFVLKAFNFYFG